jgi:transcriptional regulator with XRE-family HTH domain
MTEVPEEAAGIGDRLRQARAALGLTGAALANAMGFSQAFISGIEHGRSQVSGHFMRLLAATYAVNLNWLISGVGSMFTRSEVDPGRQQAEVRPDRLRARLTEFVLADEELSAAVVHRRRRAGSAALALTQVEQLYAEGDAAKISALEAVLAGLLGAPARAEEEAPPAARSA